MGPGGRIVRCLQGLGRVILLTVVHAAGSKGLPSPDIVARAPPPTLAAEDDECSEGKVPETHDSDSNDEADGETVVLTIFARVEVTLRNVVTGIVFVDGGGWIGAGGGLGCDFVLKLFIGLTATGDVTAFGAFFDGQGNVIRDHIRIFLYVGCLDAKSSADDLSGKTKKSLSDLVNARERICEARNESYTFTMGVVLEVDSTLREESGVVCRDLIVYEPGIVLRDETAYERAIDDVIELCRPRVGVRGVETTWAKETDSERDIVPDGRGHAHDMGSGGESTSADGCSRLRILKIIHEIFVGKVLEPLKVCRGPYEVLDELGIVGLSGNGGEGDCGKDEES
jgi:hypothetical protein